MGNKKYSYISYELLIIVKFLKYAETVIYYRDDAINIMQYVKFELISIV